VECGPSNLEWTVTTSVATPYEHTAGDCDADFNATFKVEDPCGNSVERAATFTIKDRESPVLEVAAADFEAECDGAGNAEQRAAFLAAQGGAVAKDTCSPVVAWTAAIGSEVGADPACETRTPHVFTARDECTNAINTKANFIVVDTRPPRITNRPWPKTIECDRATNDNAVASFVAANGDVEATDTCSNDTALAWRSDGTPVFNSFSRCTRRAAVGWSVQDACGNKATASTFLSITDTTHPTFTADAQPFVLAECPTHSDYREKLDTWLEAHGGAEASDECSDITWTYSPAMPHMQLDGDFTCPKQVTVTFTAEDDCGLSITTSSMFSIEDEVAPLVTVEPSDLKVDCHAKGAKESFNEWLRNFGGMQANDDCFPSPPRCPDFEDNVRKAECSYCDPTPAPICIDGRSYKNLCYAYCEGAISDDTQYIMGECTGNAAGTELDSGKMPQSPGSTHDPVCSNCGTEYNPVCSSGTRNHYNPCLAFCDGDWAFVFGACDDQTTAAPENYFVATHCNWCDGAAHSPASVVCGSDGSTYPSTCHAACEGIDSYYYGVCVDVATCGRSTLDWRSQTDGNEANIGKSCNVAVTATFQVRDPCGNEVERSATFSVVDNDAPTYTQEASNAVAECSFEGNTGSFALYTNTHGGSKATDQCQGDGVSWRSDVEAPTGTKCKRETAVNFFAGDDCDNEAKATRGSLIVLDTTPPRFTTEANDIEITCSSDTDLVVEIQTWIGARGNAVAVDDCRGFLDDGVTLEDGTEHLQWTLPAIPSTELLCNRKQYFKFTASDGCKNKASTTGSVTVIDTTQPVLFKGVADKTIDCNSDLGDGDTVAAWLETHAGAEALETCTALTWSYAPPKTLTGADRESPDVCREVVATFTATDACGNYVETRPATFSVVDNVAPVVSPPQDKAVECARDGSNLEDWGSWVDGYGGASARDACEVASDLQWTTSASPFESLGSRAECSDSKSTLTVTVGDTCGNDNTTESEFIITDTFPPSLVGEGNALTHYCDARCDSMGKENRKAEKLFEHWANVRHGCLGVADCSSVEWRWAAHQREIDDDEVVGIIQFKSADNFDSSSLCGQEGSVRFLATDGCGHKAFRVLQFSFPIIEGATATPEPPPLQPPPPPPSLPASQCDICSNSGGKGKGKATITSLSFKWSGASGTTIAVSGAAVSQHVLQPGSVVTISASRLPTNLIIAVGGESRKFHTSCSEPIYLGLTGTVPSGSLELVDFTANGMTKAQHCPGSVPANSGDEAGCCYAFNIEGSAIMYSKHHTSTREGCEERTAANKLNGERFGPATSCAALIHKQTARTGESGWSPDACSVTAESIDVCSRPIAPAIPPPPPPTALQTTTSTLAPVICTPIRTDICGGSGSKSRPSSITLQYVGGGPVLTSSQGGKSSVTGSSSGTATITFYSKKISGTAVVQPGEAFTIGDGDGVDAETMFHLSSGGGSQLVTMHTSCSFPLYVGDRYGGLQITGANGQQPATESCGSLPTAQCALCAYSGYKSQLSSITLLYSSEGANVNQQGSKAHGTMSGTFPAETTISNNGFSISISDGQSFTLSGRLGAETSFNVAGIGSVAFHTSCSVPLNTGDRFGPFTVLGGGPCDVEAPPVDTPSAGGASGCCYSYAYASVGGFAYGNYVDTTLNQCSLAHNVGGGIAFEVDQTCSSLQSKHNAQRSGCCFEYQHTMPNPSETVYTYDAYTDSMESDCNVGVAPSGAAGIQFELGTSCSALKLQHEGADVRCQTCDSSDDARPTMLTFKFVGGSALTNPQNGVAMVEQDVDPVGVGAVIKCFGSSGGANFDRSTLLLYVELNADFTLGLGGDQILDYITSCEVHTGAQLGQSANIREHTQTVTFATACHFGGSLNVGDIFGSIQLTGYRTYDASLNSHVSGPSAGADCGILSVNEGDDDAENLVNSQGCGKDICATLESSASVLETLVLQLNLADAHVYTNEQGDWEGGRANRNAFFDPQTGSNTAQIKTVGNELQYRETNVDGDRFEISASAYDRKKLGRQVTFLVQDPHTKTYKTRIKINTNCDYPLHVGDKFGVLEIIGYVGSNGPSCKEVAYGVLMLLADNQTLTPKTGAGSASGSFGSLSNGGFVGILLMVIAMICSAGILLVVRKKAAQTIDLKHHDIGTLSPSETGDSEVSELKWDPSTDMRGAGCIGTLDVARPPSIVSSAQSAPFAKAGLGYHPKWDLNSLLGGTADSLTSEI
jgi:hypothetical protein